MPDYPELIREKTNPQSFDEALKLLETKSIFDLKTSNTGVQSRVINVKGRMENCQITLKKDFMNSRCSCGINMSGVLCSHAVATMLLYHERYPERYEQLFNQPVLDELGIESNNIDDIAAPIKIDKQALRHLLQYSKEPKGQLRLRFTELPATSQEWDRCHFTVDLLFDDRVLSCNNLSRLAEGEVAAAKMIDKDYSAQDQALIKLLHKKALRKGSSYSFNSLDMADFFHLLINHHQSYYQDKPLVIHSEMAELSVDARRADNYYYLTPSLTVKGKSISVKMASSLIGRGGLWVAQNFQYYWLPATMGVSQVKSLLESDELAVREDEFINWQEEEAAGHSPVKIHCTEHNPLNLHDETFHPVLQLDRRSQTIQARLSFEYNNTLVSSDESLLWDGVAYIARNSDLEDDSRQTLIEAGFIPSDIDVNCLFLEEPYQVGEFVYNVLPELANTWKIFNSDLFTHYVSNIGDIGVTAQPISENEYWVDVQLNFGVNDELKAKWSDLLQAVANKQAFVEVGDGQIGRISDELRQTVQQMGSVREIEKGQFRFTRHLSLAMEKVLGQYFEEGSAEWLTIKQELLLKEGSVPSKVRPELIETLRPYQREGVVWLQAMHRVQFNCILADEMGLGKTIQTLAFLEGNCSRDSKILILCPKSLMENWANEIKKFTPHFSSQIISGANRQELYDNLGDTQVIITSYATMRRDIQQLRQIQFDFMVLDEAQNMKNVQSQTAQNCRLIKSHFKLLLSGTPLENSVKDLWSLFDFLLPGLLGKEREFMSLYEGDNADYSTLTARIKPFILRRGKENVDAQLPPKQEQVIFFNLSEEQKALYAAILEDARQVKDSTNNKIKILAAITRLRQICCFPEMIPDLVQTADEVPSAKMELLKELILEAIASKRRILLFSQFTKALKRIRQWLEEENIDFEYLDGQTKERQAKVDQFNESETPIFLISLKAGGTGLNLTGADTVIHFDLWWNPMIEDQATDRAHRIGQTKSVTAIKLVARDTIEENILKLQDHKRKLFKSLIEVSPDKLGSLSKEDLDYLLS